MAGTWDNAPTGSVFADKMNSELYFAENRRNRWTTQGSIRTGSVGQGQRFRAPNAGIHQNWGSGGEQYQGASLSGRPISTGSFSPVMDLVNKHIQGIPTRTLQRAQGIQNWQGAYQQAANAAQLKSIGNQMANIMTTPSPTSSLSSPIAQINQNLAQWNQNAQQQKQQAVNNWQGTYQQGSQALQAQQWQAIGNQMANTMTAGYTPPQPLSPPANTRAQRRQGQRTPGWR